MIETSVNCLELLVVRIACRMSAYDYDFANSKVLEKHVSWLMRYTCINVTWGSVVKW